MKLVMNLFRYIGIIIYYLPLEHISNSYDIDELPYTFDHIWTNLLTQCTPVPVPVFCYFSMSGFPHIKSAQIFWENPRKNQRCRIFGNHPGALPARPRVGPRQGAAWTPG